MSGILGRQRATLPEEKILWEVTNKEPSKTVR